MVETRLKMPEKVKKQLEDSERELKHLDRLYALSTMPASRAQYYGINAVRYRETLVRSINFTRSLYHD